MRSRGKVSSWEVTFLRGNGERLRLTKRKVWKRSIVLIVVRRGRQGPLSLVELYYSSRGSDTPTTQVARFAGLSERWGSARAPRRPLGLVPLSKEDGKRKPQAPLRPSAALVCVLKKGTFGHSWSRRATSGALNSTSAASMTSRKRKVDSSTPVSSSSSSRPEWAPSRDVFPWSSSAAVYGRCPNVSSRYEKIGRM